MTDTTPDTRPRCGGTPGHPGVMPKGGDGGSTRWLCKGCANCDPHHLIQRPPAPDTQSGGRPAAHDIRSITLNGVEYLPAAALQEAREHRDEWGRRTVAALARAYAAETDAALAWEGYRATRARAAAAESTIAGLRAERDRALALADNNVRWWDAEKRRADAAEAALVEVRATVGFWHEIADRRVTEVAGLRERLAEIDGEVPVVGNRVPINIHPDTRKRLTAFLMAESPSGRGFTQFIEDALDDAGLREQVEGLRAALTDAANELLHASGHSDEWVKQRYIISAETALAARNPPAATRPVPAPTAEWATRLANESAALAFIEDAAPGDGAFPPDATTAAERVLANPKSSRKARDVAQRVQDRQSPAPPDATKEKHDGPVDL